MAPDTRSRPAVSVVLPFLGDASDAAEAIAAMQRIERGPGDQLILVDNTPDNVAAPLAEGSEVEVVPAAVKRSAYAARNEGAELARCDWLLFIDADCRPTSGVLDAYFAEPIDAACGALAGEVRGIAVQETLAARYARSRSYLSLAVHRQHPYLPMAPTANFLVRREVWQAIGGFPEGMTAAGGDTWFSWRLQEAGWRLCFRPAALVEHFHRETVADLARQTARNAAGAAWLNRVRPGSIPAPRLFRGLARSIAGAGAFALTGQLERARFKLVDGIVVIAQGFGYRAGHAAATASAGTPGRVVVMTEFPRRGDGLQELRREADRLRIEAARRAADPAWAAARGLAVRFWEDEGSLRCHADLLWLLCRHPLRASGDLFRSSDGDRGSRTPLRRIAPAARRIANVGAPLAAGDRDAAPIRSRLARLAGVSEDECPVADRAA